MTTDSDNEEKDYLLDADMSDCGSFMCQLPGTLRIILKSGRCLHRCNTHGELGVDPELIEDIQ